MNPDEAYGIKLATEPFLHGDHIYFTLNWIEKNKYASSINRFDGSKMEKVTSGNHERSAQWLGNTLYYVSYGKKVEKIMKTNPISEPVEIYSSESIQKFIFHKECIIAIVTDKADRKAPFATSRVKYRFDSKGLLRKNSKLVIICEKAETLVEGDFNVTDVASNGNRLVFVATAEDDDREIQNVYELDLKSREYQKLTERGGAMSSICVAPDGTVAFTGHQEGTKPWAVEKLIMPEKKFSVEIGKNASNSIVSDGFASGSQSLLYDEGKYYMIGQDGGCASLYSWDGKVHKVSEGEKVVHSITVSSGNVGFIYSSPEKPSIISFNGELDLNPEIHGRKPLKVSSGRIEGWLLLTDKKNPTVLFVHGGPHSAYGYAYYIEFNYLASNGLNILYANPRGSAGYGQDYASGCVGDWGGSDMRDLFDILDKSVEEFSLAEKLAVSGGSYGGYMVNAIITKTDRFKCAVSERSISNLLSMCGTSDIGFWFNPEEISVTDPWSKVGIERLMEFSPISKAKSARTPTMFIHGEEDYRCPIEQAEQMYTALRMNGIDSVLVRYIGDGHEHARRGIPKNMKDRLQRKLEWFNLH
ncbi:MAG: S9 family peptidase [Thermoplasmataceae archaeon]